jgi:hypothetical protein
MCPDTEQSVRLAFPQWEELEPTSRPPALDVLSAVVPTATTTKIVVFSSTFSPSMEDIRLYSYSGPDRDSETAIIDWRRNSTLNPNWPPWGDGHGCHHRIFTDAEEHGILNYIANNYINAGRLFTDVTFREIAVQAYLEKHQKDEDIR